MHCVSKETEITLWINGFEISQFIASTLDLREKRPVQIGSIESFAAHPSGSLAFAFHSMPVEEPPFLLREVRLKP